MEMSSQLPRSQRPPAKTMPTNGSLGAYQKFNWKKYVTTKKYIPYWIGLIVILVLVALTTIYHKQIVDFLKPVSARIRSYKWGWIIPVLILIAISFPPLFGHEIVAVLCGVIYGLWIGFAIVAAGTFLGEIATYFAFKYVFRRKAIQLERTNLNYAALATITREGGFLVVFIVRLSAIPSHFTTAVFATCGVAFWIFLVATFFTLPKQLVTVYLGIILENPSGSKVVSDVVLGITFLVTLIAAGYIYWQMRRIRPRLIAAAQSDVETDQAFSVGTEYNGYNPAPTNIAGGHLQETVASPLLSQSGKMGESMGIAAGHHSGSVEAGPYASIDDDHNSHHRHPYGAQEGEQDLHEVYGDTGYGYTQQQLPPRKSSQQYYQEHQHQEYQQQQQQQQYQSQTSANNSRKGSQQQQHNVQQPNYQTQNQNPRQNSQSTAGGATGVGNHRAPYPRESMLGTPNAPMHWQQHSTSTVDLDEPLRTRDMV